LFEEGKEDEMFGKIQKKIGKQKMKSQNGLLVCK